MAFLDIFNSNLMGCMSLILVIIGVVVMVCWQPSLHMDPAEPPLLKPVIPYIGHAIGFLRYQTNYLSLLNKMHSMPVYTLPILNKKIYVVASPSLLQSVFRCKELSFEPFMLEFSQRLLGVSDKVMEPTRRKPENAKAPSFVQQVIKEIYTSLSGGSLVHMNLNTLNSFASVLNSIHDTTLVEGLYVWLRSTLTLATTNSMFGAYNPMRLQPHLIDFYWDFENNLTPLLLNFMPSLLAPKAHRGRQEIKSALSKYYISQYDMESDVAQITKQRAALLRKHGMSDHDIGEFELGLLHGALANTPPILFWLLVQILASAPLTAAIRNELLGIISSAPCEDGTRETSIDITKFESHCPLLVSAYRETLRLANSHIGVRRVMTDTWITDGNSTYLLKAGADVQMPAEITHLSTDTWGPTAKDFDPGRFLKPEFKARKEGQDFRDQKKAYHPFGGGKHLCPGRNIAFAPCLGIVALLLLGFEVKNIDNELLKVPEIRSVKFGEAVAKPFGDGLELGALIGRRKGWEDVIWIFAS
ncbi:cytochrome P450 [Stipitochalara longipes BDJ]|nr:cytochrome P450 [Stipitochalara longipes BDJ]